MMIRSILRHRFVAALSFAVLGTALATTAGAQMPMPAGGNGKPPLSPPAKAETTLDGKAITIKYSAPSIRGRVIMGGLVPYGEVWRTGANEATSLVTEIPLKIGELSVPVGSYTLYTLPAAPGTPWQLIINKQTGQWGTVYKPELDLGRTPLKHDSLAAPQELMSLSFEKTGKHSAELHIKWDKSDEWVKIEAK